MIRSPFECKLLNYMTGICKFGIDYIQYKVVVGIQYNNSVMSVQYKDRLVSVHYKNRLVSVQY